MKKRVILIVIVSFVLYNLSWYFLIHNLYDSFVMSDMEKLNYTTYQCFDSDDYGYIVSFPGYLHFNSGCLSVTDSKSSSSLIIWPQYGNNDYEYGIYVEYKSDIYQIMMTKDRRSVDINDQEVIDANKEIIDCLYTKAEKKWERLQMNR